MELVKEIMEEAAHLITEVMKFDTVKRSMVKNRLTPTTTREQ